jgi:DNA-binding NarL/FixJ family response regulator
MHSDRHFVVEMFRAGARAFLLKDCATDELVGAIRAVVEGEAYLGPSIERGLGMDLASLDYLIAEEDQRTELTPREWEILQLVAEGRSTREIASSLNLSAKTVENHRQSVMNKLDLHNVADLTKYAIRCGLTDTELL